MGRVPWCAVVCLVLASAGAAPKAAAGDSGTQAPETAAKLHLDLKAPIQVSLGFRDGTRMRGRVTAFDSHGFNGDGVRESIDSKTRKVMELGPFTRARWAEIDPSDLLPMLNRALDARKAHDMLLKGSVLLAVGKAKAGEEALERAVRLDPDMKAHVTEVRAEAQAEAERAVHAEYLARYARMAEAIPRGGANAWGPLTMDEQKAALAAVRARAEQICRDVGFEASVLETEYFILYGAVKPAAMAECARSLDTMYARVLELFGVPAGLNLFWGKAVVLLTPTEATFRTVNVAGFNATPFKSAAGLCVYEGPMVFINIFWSDDQDVFDSILIHETVHGIVYRYYSAAQLPQWANEGLSEYIAAVSFPSSPVHKGRMPQALQYIRSGGSVERVLALNSGDGSWPGPDAIGYAIGYASVRLMVRQQPEAFGRWIRAVKGGKPWEQAMLEDFGHPVEHFASTVEQWYRTRE